MATSVKIAFHPEVLILKLANIKPLKAEITEAQRTDKKYQQIASSVTYVGLVEPLVVFPEVNGRKYWLLDGHTRLDVLKQNQIAEARCIVATDDESYTYNRRVNYLPPIAEHFMILKALANGVTEERIGLALKVDVADIRKRRNLLDGICPETADLLKTKRVTATGFAILRRMKPVRQIKCAQLMISASNYSVGFAKAFLDVTPDELLAQPAAIQRRRDLSNDRKSLIEEETDTLLKGLKQAEQSYGRDMLDLVTSCRFVGNLLANIKVRRYLTKHHGELLQELDQLVADTAQERPVDPKPVSRAVQAPPRQVKASA